MIKNIAGWSNPLELLKAEVEQKEYEGFVVPESLKSEIGGLDQGSDSGIEEKITACYEKLEINLSDDELLDRFRGAWAGRACGCAPGRYADLLSIRRHYDMSLGHF